MCGALLKHMVDMPVALLIANNSGRYVDANDLATRLTGYSRAELLRISVWDLTRRPPPPRAGRCGRNSSSSNG